MKQSEASKAGRLLAAMRQTRYLTCPVCREEFEGVGRRIYCSQRCRQAAYASTHRDQERERQRVAQAKRRGLLRFERARRAEGE
jgi:hypothetical protein